MGGGKIMEISNYYAIWYPQGVYLFSESSSGALNWEGRYASDAESIVKSVIAKLGSDVLEEELVQPHEEDEFWLYQNENLMDKQYRCIRYHRPLGKAPATESRAFLRRIPVIMQALEYGDFVRAARVLINSKKLSLFPGLVYELLGQSAFLVLALYVHNTFDSQREALLAAALSDQGREDNPYAKLFRYARDVVDCRDINCFYKECSSRILNYLVDQRRPLIVPVVGTEFRQTLRDLGRIIDQVTKEGRKRQLLEGLTGWDSRTRNYIENINVYCSPEPYNPHDCYAIAVLLDDGDRCRQLGYLKREMARLLAPLVKSGVPLQARLARFSFNNADISLRV